MRSSRAWWLCVSAVVSLVLSTSAPAGQADELDPVFGPGQEAYPDLVPDVTFVFSYRSFVHDPATNTFVPGPARLQFDTWSQNLGTVALDLRADEPTDLMASTVSQCVSWGPPGVCRERRAVGGFAWHDEHTHFHYQDFAIYELRHVRRNGAVNYTRQGLVARSDKVSFCLLDSTSVRDDASPVPTYVGCTPTRQGISPGWSDIYGVDLEGQEVSLEGLGDGVYALVVTQDYNGTILESNDANNRVEVLVELTGLGSSSPQARILERRYPVL